MKALFIVPRRNSDSFEYVMWLRAAEMVKTLEGMGVHVLQLEVPDLNEPSMHVVEKVENFDPDFIISPNYSYILVSSVSPENLMDRLQRPIIAMWDDPIGALGNNVYYHAKFLYDRIEREKELARQMPFRYQLLRILKVGRERLWKSTTPVVSNPVDELDNLYTMKLFRDAMIDPRIIHFSWDTAHIRAVNELGLTAPERVHWYPTATYLPYIEYGMSARPSYQRDISFCGNLYLGYMEKHQYWQNEQIRELVEWISERKCNALELSNWDLFLEGVERLPLDFRKSHAFEPNRKPYWDLYVFTIWYAVNSLVRLNVMNAINKQIHVYGLFADSRCAELLRNHSNFVYEKNCHHFDELPEVYASTKINVCLSNSLIYQGVPSKLIDCVASGGFALCDPKDDLLDFFGPDVERIFFRNSEELNEKVDYFLNRPEERECIVLKMQSKIRENCRLEDLFEKVLLQVKLWGTKQPLALASYSRR